MQEAWRSCIRQSLSPPTLASHKQVHQYDPKTLRQGMEALKDGLQAVNTTRLERDYGVRVPVLLKAAGTPPRPGAQARERGLRPKHPVRQCRCRLPGKAQALNPTLEAGREGARAGPAAFGCLLMREHAPCLFSH